MPIRNLLVASVALAACNLAALAQVVSFPGGPLTATINQNYTFPPVGVASNETLQVNLANTASAVNGTTPGAMPTPASCTGTVTVTNAAGALIGKANPFTVAGGNIQSITVPYGSIGASGGARTEMLITVQHLITIPSTVPCNLIYSLETFLTTTGETHVLLGNTAANGVINPLTGVISPVPPTTGPGGVIGGH